MHEKHISLTICHEIALAHPWDYLILFILVRFSFTEVKFIYFNNEKFEYLFVSIETFLLFVMSHPLVSLSHTICLHPQLCYKML